MFYMVLLLAIYGYRYYDPITGRWPSQGSVLAWQHFDFLLGYKR
jgi:hypothetical protein